MLISRTFIHVLADPASDTVTLSAFVQIDGRWYAEPRCVEAATFTRVPDHAAIHADVLEAISDGLFGTTSWWRPVTAPQLGQPTFLFPPAK